MTFPAVRRAPALAVAAVLSAAALVTISFTPSTFAQGNASTEVQRKVIQRHDTGAPGFEAVLVDVTIPVGGREGRHTHPGLALIKVESGTLTLDYEGKPTATYNPGDSFMVEAGKIHEGINKGTIPIKVVGAFVVPKGVPLTTQVK